MLSVFIHFSQIGLSKLIIVIMYLLFLHLPMIKGSSWNLKVCCIWCLWFWMNFRTLNFLFLIITLIQVRFFTILYPISRHYWGLRPSSISHLWSRFQSINFHLATAIQLNWYKDSLNDLFQLDLREKMSNCFDNSIFEACVRLVEMMLIFDGLILIKHIKYLINSIIKCFIIHEMICSAFKIRLTDLWITNTF